MRSAERTGMPALGDREAASMKPPTRRLLQAVLDEFFAVAFVGPVLALVFDKPPAFDRLFGLPQSALPRRTQA